MRAAIIPSLARSVAILIAATTLVTATVLTATGATTSAEVGGQIFTRQIDIAAPGPLGAVTVIGDSVLLGSGLWAPTLPDRLAERGWGPIKYRANQGMNATGSSKQSSAFWIRQWRSQGWDAPNVIVNIGANDSGTCVTDVECARRRIQELVDEIGPGKTIWWPQITRFFTKFPEQDTWNRALQDFADASPNFHTWDWPSELVEYDTPDGTHLTVSGYRRRSVRMAELFTLAAASGEQVDADVELPTPTQLPSTFVSLPAERVIDSRSDATERRGDDETLTVDFGDSIPSDATAVAIYVGAAGISAPGYFAAGPCGQPPAGSTVNFVVGPAVGAPTIVALGDDADVCIFSKGSAEIIVDLQGTFVSGSVDRLDAAEESANDLLGLTPFLEPRRLLDTRTTPDNRTGQIEVSVATSPSSIPTAVALNLTAVRPGATGFLTASDCSETGGVASVNFRADTNAAAFTIINVSETGTICIDRSTATDVIVDITGVFSPGGGLQFVPVPPTRVLDTRDGTGGFTPIHGSGQTAQTRVAPPNAEAVTGTITTVKPLAGNFVSAEACTGLTTTSSVNAQAGAVVANSITTAVSAGGDLCFTAHVASNTVFDTTGWWVRP